MNIGISSLVFFYAFSFSKVQNITLISLNGLGRLSMVSFFPRTNLDSYSRDSSNGLINFCKGLFFGRWLVGIFLSLGDNLESRDAHYSLCRIRIFYFICFMISIFDTVEAICTSCTCTCPCHIVTMGMVISNKSYIYSIYRAERHTCIMGGSLFCCTDYATRNA